MSNKENEKLTNSCEDSNSKKINDEGRRILETAANALNSGNPDSRMNFRNFNNKGENIMINNEELMEACEKGELEKVKSIIEKGIDIDLEYNNWTPLTKASEKGHLNIVKYLVENGAKINKENGHDWTALISASKEGLLEIVEYLIEKGANIEIKTDCKWTALTFASMEGHLEVVKHLIKSGADVYVKDDKNISIIDCILNGVSDVENALLSDKHFNIIKILQEKGVYAGNYKKSNGKMVNNKSIRIKIEDDTIYLEDEKGEVLSKYNKKNFEEEI